IRAVQCPDLLYWKVQFVIQYFVDDVYRFGFTDRIMSELFVEIADDVKSFGFNSISFNRIQKRIELFFNILFTALILEVVDLIREMAIVPDGFGNVQSVEQGVVHILNLIDAV